MIFHVISLLLVIIKFHPENVNPPERKTKIELVIIENNDIIFQDILFA